tara:strand:+ start:715 stop:1683 length:969 start_codon:yes stop_codon:yes gene_type:complete
MKTHRVSQDSQGQRLDVYMIGIISDLTRSKIQQLIKENKILINGNSIKPSYSLKGTENISYEIDPDSSPSENPNKIIFEPMDFDIIFEDEYILVINKSPGLVVHPGAGNYSGTLLNGVIDKINQAGFKSIPGLVHRLDKETTGVIIIAKDYKTHSFIAKQFEERTVNKIYHALVWGSINNSGTIEGNIARNPKDRKTFILTNGDGRYSKTDYSLIDSMSPISYVKLKPNTGRTHQLRVHMKSIGHPILSDDKYSGGKSMIKSFHVKYTNILKRVMSKIDRVALHAKSIEIIHPDTKKKIIFSAPIPNDINQVIEILENNESV